MLVCLAITWPFVCCNLEIRAVTASVLCPHHILDLQTLNYDQNHMLIMLYTLDTSCSRVCRHSQTQLLVINKRLPGQPLPQLFDTTINQAAVGECSAQGTRAAAQSGPLGHAGLLGLCPGPGLWSYRLSQRPGVPAEGFGPHSGATGSGQHLCLDNAAINVYHSQEAAAEQARLLVIPAQSQHVTLYVCAAMPAGPVDSGAQCHCADCHLPEGQVCRVY